MQSVTQEPQTRERAKPAQLPQGNDSTLSSAAPSQLRSGDSRTVYSRLRTPQVFLHPTQKGPESSPHDSRPATDSDYFGKGSFAAHGVGIRAPQRRTYYGPFSKAAASKAERSAQRVVGKLQRKRQLSARRHDPWVLKSAQISQSNFKNAVQEA